MFGFIGSHYVELVAIAMGLFAVGLFVTSLTDALQRPGQD